MKISNTEYARRRRNLMAMMEANSIAIIPSAREVQRSRDTEYPFRQNSDFYYLSGFVEPDSVLVLVPGRVHGEFVMFCRERDPSTELWHGSRAGPDGACDQFGADDAFPIGDVDEILPGLIEGRERVYYSMGRSSRFDREIMEWVNTIRSKEATGAVPPGEFTDLDHMLHDLRLIKSAAEQKLMRRAGEITAGAHRHIMRSCEPGMYEYQLEGELHHQFVLGGARYPAYLSIVGSGRNACTLHYVENNARMRDGDLVLVDAGCEFEYYAADVTRTFPVNGRFNPEQRALYEVVLAAHEAAVEQVRAGNHWNQPHDASVRVITAGLLELGLLEGEVDELIETQAYRDFYMHRVGHWLGLDVHDVGDYRVGDEWRLLEAGMVMTIEPGIYVAPNNKSVARKWRGIGVRIEDDVLITRDGCDILTADAPRTVEEIEATMAA
ncbi:Xaa-Pro aminopeptidase [Pseudohalioglobus lutimaris]|uniref:Xaa-Pro aminopeptidase n=1 Tax=Pseudohalioglobus lutimaris TaxID=1737061 RepID=A0A2N5X3P5_9GAMM|nr:Xaa-Pro aminopeptidase [Pseudohalioglobus lutimaris]PLW69126.1 Xaa-Pro aminopeptidase [Pseudohalioglobus lutimaris]